VTLARTPLTFADAMTRVAGVLTFARCRSIVHRSDRAVRSWSEPASGKSPTVVQAFALDTAYRLAGGEGAPFAEALAHQVDTAVAQQTACQRELAAEIQALAKESGEAIAASIVITMPNPSPRDTHRALVEAEQAHQSSGRLLRRLSSFLPRGAGPRGENTGGISA
jgi:hypothetical protein